MAKVFHYQDYHAFLRDALAGKRSTRAWAQKLGFNAPSHLVMILQGKRRYPARCLPALADELSLKVSEAKYLEDLIQFQHAKSPEEKLMVEQRLNASRLRALGEKEGSKFVTLGFDTFRLVRDPIHSFILEMTLIRGFTWDAAWILKRLGAGYTLSQVREAMDRLVALRLIRVEGTSAAKTHERLTTTHDVPNVALRESHRQLIEMAAHAIETQHVQERDITSSTVTIDAAKLPLAKEMLKNFRREFCRALESDPGQGTHTYQINLQLFRITEPSVLAPKETEKGEMK